MNTLKTGTSCLSMIVSLIFNLNQTFNARLRHVASTGLDLDFDHEFKTFDSSGDFD
jgi:hypothetical protein